MVNIIEENKKYWTDYARYDWYKARKKGTIFERIFYYLKTKYILSLIQFENKRILDMGCGTGVNTYDFYEKSKKTVGIDISPWAIKKAKKNFKMIPFHVMDAEKTKFKDNYFDIIINSGIIQYVENSEPNVNEMHRILKGGNCNSRSSLEIQYK